MIHIRCNECNAAVPQPQVGQWSRLVTATGPLNPFCIQSNQNSGPGQQGWIIPCFLHPQGAWGLHCVGVHQRAARAGKEGPALAVGWTLSAEISCAFLPVVDTARTLQLVFLLEYAHGPKNAV